MSKITVVALVAALFLVSCGEAPPVHSEAEPEEIQAGAPMGETVDVKDIVAAGIYLKRLAFESMPGRTGILAEKPLYSVFAEEVIIRDFFQDREGGFYLDVGAAWAVTRSNTYYLEKTWDGRGSVSTH